MNKNVDFVKVLRKGESEAIKGKELVELLGYSNIRALQADISEYRLNHPDVMILSSSKGYFLPSSNEKEIDRFIKVTEKRSKTMMRWLKSAKQHKKQIKGQLKIEIEV